MDSVDGVAEDVEGLAKDVEGLAKDVEGGAVREDAIFACCSCPDISLN